MYSNALLTGSIEGIQITIFYCSLVRISEERQPDRHEQAEDDRQDLLPLLVPLLRPRVHPHLPHSPEVQLQLHGSGKLTFRLTIRVWKENPPLVSSLGLEGLVHLSYPWDLEYKLSDHRDQGQGSRECSHGSLSLIFWNRFQRFWLIVVNFFLSPFKLYPNSLFRPWFQTDWYFYALPSQSVFISYLEILYYYNNHRVMCIAFACQISLSFIVYV